MRQYPAFVSQKLLVHNFGPLQKCEIETGRFLCMIGPQASGKSTICKLLYYFQMVRDETFNCLFDSLDSGRSSFSIKLLWDLLRKRFLETWGPTPLPRNLHLEYHYNQECKLEIRFVQEHHKLISPIFPRGVNVKIESIFAELCLKYKLKPRSSSLFGSPEDTARELMRNALVRELKARCNELFSLGHELLFIPAGRSLVSTLSDQLQNIDPKLLDFPMRRFIERINRTKSFFGKPLDTILLESQLTSGASTYASPALAREAQRFVARVMKGEYLFEQGEGRIYVNSGVYTKINFASSGQQEATWILLSLFLVALEGTNAHLFIEEPEAHLFPDAQKEIVDFIAFIYNNLRCQITITTHSPYILSSINNLLFAHMTGAKHPEQTAHIVARDRWLDPLDVKGYYVSGGKTESLMDNDLHLLRSELVDSVTKKINDEFDRLFEL